MHRSDDDQGFSLTEVLIAMGIMAVVMSAVVTATLQIYSGTKQIEQVSVARDELDNSFRRLDRELRYATWVTDKPDWNAAKTRFYMEYTIPPRDRLPADTAEPPLRCRQLFVDLTTQPASLRLTGWDLGAHNAATRATLATGVVVETGGKPFEAFPPGSSPYSTASPGTAGVGSGFSNAYEMIRLRFRVEQGKVALPFDSVFTSQNITAENAAGRASSEDKKCGTEGVRA